MENIDYSNLEFRLNILYDCIYNKNSTECYYVKPIIKNNILLEDIKESKDYDYSDIFTKCTFKFMEYSNKKLHFKRTSDTTYPCTVSFGKYINENDSDNIRGNELKNIYFLYLFSEFVTSDKIKNILLPISFFDISHDIISKKDSNLHNSIMEKFNKEDKLYCLITEHYFKLYTLRSYIELNPTIDEWKSIFFQIFYCLHKISERLPNFSHNMLNIDSIKLYKKKDHLKQNFRIKKDNYEILICGLEVKLSDFDKAIIPSLFDDQNTSDGNDIYYLANNLLTYLKSIKFDIPEELLLFLENLNKNENLDTENINKLQPLYIIKNNMFFNNFLHIEFDNNSVSSVDIKQEKISRLNGDDSSISYSSSNKNYDKKKEKNIGLYNSMKGGKKNKISRLAELEHKKYNDAEKNITSSSITSEDSDTLEKIRNEVDYKKKSKSEKKNKTNSDEKRIKKLKKSLKKMKKIRRQSKDNQSGGSESVSDIDETNLHKNDNGLPNLDIPYQLSDRYFDYQFRGNKDAFGGYSQQQMGNGNMMIPNMGGKQTEASMMQQLLQQEQGQVPNDAMLMQQIMNPSQNFANMSSQPLQQQMVNPMLMQQMAQSIDQSGGGNNKKYTFYNTETKEKIKSHSNFF